MTFDEMLETWRAQDKAPLYGVDRDLFRLVLDYEQADLRREMRWEQVAVYGVSAGLAAMFAFFFSVIFYGRETVSDYVALGIALGVVLVWAGAYWVSRKRQALRERRFGNSLQEEVRRSMSLVDYQLSRNGRWTASLLIFSPIAMAGVLIIWLGLRINEKPLGWSEVWIVLLLVLSWAWSTVWSSRVAEKKLLPRRRRLSELLELLDENE